MKKSILIRDVPPAVHRQLKVICAKEQRTMKEVLMEMLTDYTNKRAA